MNNKNKSPKKLVNRKIPKHLCNIPIPTINQDILLGNYKPSPNKKVNNANFQKPTINPLLEKFLINNNENSNHNSLDSNILPTTSSIINDPNIIKKLTLTSKINIISNINYKRLRTSQFIKIIYFEKSK